MDSAVCKSCNQGPLSGYVETADGLECPPCFFSAVVKSDRHTMREFIRMCRDRGLCVYCGEFADELDHVIPRSWGLPTYTVPACADCNQLASDRLCAGLKEKRRMIHDLLRSRHRRVLKTPDWDPDELREMGHALRKQIVGFMRAKQIVKSRVDFAGLEV